MAKLVKCKKCEYQVARTTKYCIHCSTRNPGLTATDHITHLFILSAIMVSIMMLYKIVFNEQFIQIAEVEAAGFEKQYQRHTLMQNAQYGWVGQWKSERIELYQFTDPAAVDLEFFSKRAAPDNIFGWSDACIHKNIILLSKGQNACQILKQL